MKVLKTVIQVTILHPEGQPVEGVPLAGIGHEIDEGGWLGQIAMVSSEPVPPEKLKEEQIALGNDGTFFEEEEEEDADPFAGQFMQPYVSRGEYFEVETTNGTEIVPADLVNRTTETVNVSFLLDYLEGKPNNEDEELERKTGWLARMSANGYMDCTDWTAHGTEDEAVKYLVEQYGNE